MIQTIRSQFPALSRTHNGEPLVFLDGPAGTQVPEMVIDACSDYYRMSNANSHGHFITSMETTDLIDWVRERCAALLNAPDKDCISLGANMTSLAFKLSRSFSRVFQPGDEVVITQLDHEANRGPWLYLEKHGVKVREINLLPNGTLDYQDAAQKINSKTKLVCAGWASNILGTVNDMAELRRLSKDAGAWLLIDAVHYAPHFAIDVTAVDCDFLLCSAYKFYGPHVGILYSRPGLLDTLDTDRIRTAPQKAPGRIETGTPNHSAFAGVGACIEWLATLGAGDTLREKLEDAYSKLGAQEGAAARQLYNGLKEIPGITVYGPDFDEEQRSPTIAWSLEGHDPATICKFLGDHGICAWDGHFYAIRTVEVLGLSDIGGVVRMGVVAYNSEAEIARTLNTIEAYTKLQS